MRLPVYILILLSSTGLLASSLHLDLEMSSSEYRLILKKLEANKIIGNEKDDPAISEALKLGDRLSKWIALVNTMRTPERAIRLTSEATRRGIPIEKPNMYSPEIIKQETRRILSDLPSEIKNVLISTESLPNYVPLDDETFISHARKVDRNYQSAARYKSVDKFRSHYIAAASKDVRGYYYLFKNNITETELRNAQSIPADKVNPILEALILVCFNTEDDQSSCRERVYSAFKNNSLSGIYEKYFSRSKKIWNDFFKIPTYARRSDIRWSSTKTVIPFNNPGIPKFGPYLRDNIEDEFRWNNWALKLSFGRYPGGPTLKFEPGVVPHVNGLGGNEIVMDANQPIEEYESQWTIRHEFGHVLGLPDCYHEFYDTEANVYVNYQLDISDLMCSRAGNMKERIFSELEKAYAK
jgi:hypothetical protein